MNENSTTGRKIGVLAATAMLHLALVALALFFAITIVSTPASASCAVNISNEPCYGNCTINVGDCSGGSCFANLGGSCFSGGNCPVNITSWCYGACTVNAVYATCYNGCGVNIASTC